MTLYSLEVWIRTFTDLESLDLSRDFSCTWNMFTKVLSEQKLFAPNKS